MIMDRHEALWLLAAKRTARKLKVEPSTEAIEATYLGLLEKFADTTGTVDLTKKIFVLPGLPYTYPEVSGLVLREMTLEDVEAIVPRMSYDTPELARQAVMARFTDPFTQMLAWDFNGKLVQTESLRLLPNGSVEVGTSVHLMKRSGMFWREAERPVFERLATLGVTTMSTLTLTKLLKYWKPIIKGFYKGEVGRVSPLTTQFTYPLDLSVFRDWSERRTAGPNWSYKLGHLTFREMHSDELLTIMSAITRMYKTSANGVVSAQLLEEKYTLDKASVLLGFSNDDLFMVRSIRPREKADHGNHTIHHTVARNVEQSLGSLVAHLWFKALGYRKATIFLRDAQIKHPQIALVNKAHDAAKIFSFEWSFVDQGVQMHGYETEIDEIVKYTPEAWAEKMGTPWSN